MERANRRLARESMMVEKGLPGPEVVWRSTKKTGPRAVATAL
jgi:hypothetical protein